MVRYITILSILFVSISASVASAGINDGLVALYQFEGNAYDSAGNNDGAEYGGVSYVDGVLGQALQLDGVDDYVRSDNFPITAEYTIAGWFFLDTEVGDLSYTSVDILSVSNGASHGILLEVVDRVDSGGDAVRYLHRSPFGDSGGYDNRYTYGYNDEIWHHIAVVRKGQTNYLYLDGQLADSVVAVNDIIGSYTLAIGQIGPSQNYRFFPGKIDDLRIYNRAIDISEILELYGMNSNIVTIPNPDFDIPVSNNTEYSRLQLVTRGYISGDYWTADFVDITTADNSIDEYGLSLINVEKPMYVVVHGWRPKAYFDCDYEECGTPSKDTPLRDYMRSLVGRMFERVDANILVWNWEYEAVGGLGDLSFPPPFHKVDAQAAKLNNVLGQVLESKSYQDDIYIIGHSLGAGIVVKTVDLNNDFAKEYLSDIKRISLFDPPDRLSLELPTTLSPLFGLFYDMTLGLQDEISSIREKSNGNIFIDNYIASNGEFFKNFGKKYDDVTNVYLNNMNHTNVVATWLIGTADPNSLSDNSEIIDASKAIADASIVGLNWESSDFSLYDLETLESLSENNSSGEDHTYTWDLVEKTGLISEIGNAFLDSYQQVLINSVFTASGLGTALYNVVTRTLTLTTGSPVATKTNISLDNNSEYITFEFKALGVADDTAITMYVDGEPLFEHHGESSNNDIWEQTPSISIKRWAGQQVELMFTLNSQNSEQTLKVKNITVYNNNNSSTNILLKVLPAILHAAKSNKKSS